MAKKALLILGIIACGILVYVVVTVRIIPHMLGASTAATSSGKTVITFMTHWSSYQVNGVRDAAGKLIAKGLQQYIDEYNALHPDIEVKIQYVDYDTYFKTLKVLSDAEMPPDIYQIYAPWGASYVKDNMLDLPPHDIQDNVLKNYESVSGVTIDGKIWGIPTEIETYALAYNKNYFKEAGIVDASGNPLPPKTWDAFVADAVKLTKKDAKGNISRYGTAFANEDSFVVDPFLSLLDSLGGSYLSADMAKTAFDSPLGVKALNAELALFKEGATDINGSLYDFGKGKVAMVIVPPWPRNGFAAAFGDAFASTVGVAPLPVLGKQASLGYSWFMGVTAGSKHKAAAWAFLKWISSDIQPSGTTRYGDLLAETIGAVPSRTVDFTGHADALGSFFMQPFVGQMKNAVYEPEIASANEAKAILQQDIWAAWSGQKTAVQALDDAKQDIDMLLMKQ